ncbi:MAG: glucosidase [Chloroflexi bacterium]|nr:MAG: glucosidase [Phototrophicales bacterium]RMF79659.1 MAG: glucosidase [Chloroflexota bacterium]
MQRKQTAEHQRLIESKQRAADWKNWGPYVSDRAWGTVREDYSANGDAWRYFPHDHARSRAYRWSEDGIAGVCNRFQNICLAVAFWNEQDPILKERFFGLSNPEGNHGEDVKEYYFYLDNTPTHSYMKMLYKYPQVAFPYEQLIVENQKRGRDTDEYELIDALQDVFETNRYFDIFIEYAKADEEDILCRITAINRSDEAAPLHILPHLWYRNTWSWGYNPEHPQLHLKKPGTVYTKHRHLGERWWYIEQETDVLFTDNVTNKQRLYHIENESPYTKDGINDRIVHGRNDAVNPKQHGSKAAAHLHCVVQPGEAFVVHTRFVNTELEMPFDDFDHIFAQRIQEVDNFFDTIHPPSLNADERHIQRQALAGLLWSKQFYHYGVELWLDGDPASPHPSSNRRHGRNARWTHLYALDVLSMPDKWEYPWFAAWDLAFHCIPIALVDPEWAKRQIIILLREWYMHPNGQIPAYEWSFSDVNPPVHAWAAWQVYHITARITGEKDTVFLEKVFHKLLLNFTWWVNRKDSDENNVFEGGFLGLDNIGVFDRNTPLLGESVLEQADGTAWMSMYCLNMLAIALELARTKPAYEDVATKFFEHFIYIADAIYDMDGRGIGLWDDEDGFFYDVLSMPGRHYNALKLRSFIGLIPLFAVEILDGDLLEQLPRFRRRMEWFIQYRPHLIKNVASLTQKGQYDCRLLSIIDDDKLKRIMTRMLDTAEFLSDYGLRSMSRVYAEQPFHFRLDGREHIVHYEPAESNSGLFGGNSNWRGPIWFPLNYLMIESLRKYYHYYGNTLTVEFPTHSGNGVTLDQVGEKIANRLIQIFRRDAENHQTRATMGHNRYMQHDPYWQDLILFYEYFHGDTGVGLGASHQTGWTALVACLLQEYGGGQT